MNRIKINNLDKFDRPSVIKKIARFLSEGRIIILPTGTIYGISCKYNDRRAVERIYKIKKRVADLPFIILISNVDDLKILATDINPAAESIIGRFWNIKNPQSLTLIFNKKKYLRKFITGGKPTIALRMAEPKLLRDIIDICGPITSTSATISGIKKFPRKIEDIPADIRKGVDLAVEYPSILPGMQSTIIDVTGNTPVLIREGKVKFEDIIGY